ncbi:MAG TPA: M23 family metallopeptidase [Puia sp.]|uniref:M23 family metallopeptidase n=1 Tax=Puia sp. TaxID=2045100 RepID=UPI002C463620|nr:M23 family metallopeptidase [Puia sp.]HVU98963.1 M23 family metallopeptidase [Puia sp.]
MRYLVLALICCCTSQAFSQLFPSAEVPHGYFRDPLAIPIHLAANFGELRPNHYHMGLDIRTQHRENLPVYAAADGYVARVSVEPGGFGQAIYINHPNGYTTVYGHLNRFFPALAAYVHDQQYRRQSWSVHLSPQPGQFPVKKGDFIAYSGNTGGSQGPHLHFEIRRTADDVNQNPLLFGLPVPDNTPPTLQRLAWYDRNLGIYEQKPHILPIRRSPSSSGPAAWSPAPSLLLVPTTRISFALSAFDTQDGSANPNGIYEAALYVDDAPVLGFQMNNISYNDTRNINAHIDYKTRETGGPFLQQLFFLSGNPSPSIYTWPVGRQSDGVIRLEDGLVHAVRIVVKDTYGNASDLRFRVQYRPDPALPPLEALQPGKKFYAGMVDGVEAPDYAFFLGEKSLYDSVTIHFGTVGNPGAGLSLPGGVSAVQAIGDKGIPLLDPVLVRLRPVTPAPTPGKVVLVCFNGPSKDVQRPEWQNGWASARFREFGNFQLVEDLEPPVISIPGIAEGAYLSKAGRIAVTVKDNLGATKGFSAVLDPEGPAGGQWLCFTNDKGLAYIYKFDEHCPPGRHTLRISVEDMAGNRSVKELHFTR